MGHAEPYPSVGAVGRAGMCKSPLAQDYHWNSKGDEGVVAFLTSNVPVVHISGGVVNPVETEAWEQRFGRNILHFKTPLNKPDKRYKKWFQCVHCYGQWVLGTDDGRATAAPPTGPVATELSAADGDVSPTLPVTETEEDGERDPFGFGASLDNEEDAQLQWPGAGPVVQAPAQSQCASADVARDAPRSSGTRTVAETSTEALTESQRALIARNRAEAVRRRQNSAPQTPPPPPSITAETSLRSRSAHGRAGSSQPEPAVPLPPVPPLPVVQVPAVITEPLRALNALLQARACQAMWQDAQTDLTSGMWSSEVRCLGLAARGTGLGKKAARREAAAALMRLLGEQAGQA